MPESIGRKIARAGAQGAGYLFARFATHPPRMPVFLPRNNAFPAQDVEFPSRDGLRLSGWFVPADNAKGGVILCHGHPGTRMETLDRARWLHTAGFHILMFDFRALGKSAGEVSGIGAFETQDLLGATDYMTQQRPEMATLPLGVYGHSMGGAVAILTTAVEPRIQAVATHGAFATLESAIRQRAVQLAGGMAPVMEESMTRHGGRWLPVDPKAMSPLDAVSQIAPRPILIMHGAKDTTISPKDAYDLFSAAKDPKRLRVFSALGHIAVHSSEREIYRETLVQFFEESLTIREEV